MVERMRKLLQIGAFVCVALFHASIVKAQVRKVPAGYPIDTIRAVIMVRSAIIALNHANMTGNYTVLRALGAPGFQLANPPARLAEIFSGLRKRRVDLSPVAVIKPVFMRKPFVNRQGMMVLTGYFPSRPEAVVFTLGYKPVAGIWKLNYISVNLVKLKQKGRPVSGVAKKKNINDRRKNKSKLKNKKRRKSSSLEKGIPHPRPRPRKVEKGNLLKKM